MKLFNRNLVLVCFGVTLLICLVLVSSRNNNVVEGFAEDDNNLNLKLKLILKQNC